MLQRALIKFDKTVFLQKIVTDMALKMSIVVHERVPGNYEIGKYQESLKTLKNNNLVPSLPAKI